MDNVPIANEIMPIIMMILVIDHSFLLFQTRYIGKAIVSIPNIRVKRC
mgnify:FL=1